MDELRFYRLAALGLLILNVGMVAFFLLTSGPRAGGPPRERPDERLGLDDQQHEAFLALAHGHQALMRDVSEEQRALLEAYFEQLNGTGATAQAEPPTEILELEERKITSTYLHLLDVKGLLRPAQLELYPDFVQLALRRILGDARQPTTPRLRRRRRSNSAAKQYQR